MYIIIIIIIVMDKSYLLIIALFGKLMTWSESEVVPFYFEQLTVIFYRTHNIIILHVINSNNYY